MSASGGFSWSSVAAPFKDRRFRGLLVYRGWFSLANGITQAAQNIYPRAVLGMGVWDMALMRTMMQGGQFAISPWVGRSIDRCGNRPVLVLSQLLVALSLVFFLLSSGPSDFTRWLILGAWVLWSAYAGINVGLYNLMLKLPPAGEARPPYVAAHEFTGSICYAASTLAGGYLLDVFSPQGSANFLLSSVPISHFKLLFALGLALRLLAVILARRIDEPGAGGVRNLLKTRGIRKETAR